MTYTQVFVVMLVFSILMGYPQKFIKAFLQGLKKSR